MQARRHVLDLAGRVYEALLGLYPRAFRDTFGSEMVWVFREASRDALAQRGWRAVVRLWVHVVVDLVYTAFHERRLALRLEEDGQLMLAKRCFDIAVTGPLLVLLAPLLALIAVAIKLDGRGPILFKDRRAGKHGRPFDMYKFRTMAPSTGRGVGTDGTGGALEVTRLGRLLRPLALDELPQLVNVLRGDMSLVGPRPEKPERIKADDSVWQGILAFRPGVGGLEQISYGFRPIDPAAKLELALSYSRTRSIPDDLRLLLRTVGALGRRG